MMKQRRIVVCISQGATGREPDIGLEGLRAAVGLVRATEQHEVDVVLKDGGLAWLGTERTQEASAIVAQLRAADVGWYASSSAAGGNEERLSGVEIVDEEKLQMLLDEADVVLRY